MASALSTPTTTAGGRAAREPLHLDLDVAHVHQCARSTSRSGEVGRLAAEAVALPRRARPGCRAMLMKYLSEYQPCRMRSTSSLNTEGGRRRRSKVLIRSDYGLLWLPWSRARPCPAKPRPYRRGQLITAVARWVSVGLALLSVPFVWDDPQVRPRAALAVASATWPTTWSASSGCSSERPRARLFRVRARRRGRGGHRAGRRLLGRPAQPHLAASSTRTWWRCPCAAGLRLRAGGGRSSTPSSSPAWPRWPTSRSATSTPSRCSSARSWAAPPAPTCARSASGWPRPTPSWSTANRALSETVAAQMASQQQQEQSLGRLQESEERYRRLLGPHPGRRGDHPGRAPRLRERGVRADGGATPRARSWASSS